MPELLQLRMGACEIFDEAQRAIDPHAAMLTSIRRDGSQMQVQDIPINISNRHIYSIAIRTAAPKMAPALDDVFGEDFTSGVITSNAATLSQVRLSPGWRQ